MIGAKFIYADLKGCNLEDCVLSDAEFRKIKFSSFTDENFFLFIVSCFRGKLQWTRFGGQYQSSDQLAYGDCDLKKYIEQCNKRIRFENKHGYISMLMRIFANYAYSPLRVLSFGLLVWILFAFLYAGHPLPEFLDNSVFGSVLCNLKPEISWNGKNNHNNEIEPFYFSAVTMTTLGYGDIIPKDWKAQLYCIIQVFLGYILLALFVASIIYSLDSW